MIPKCSLGEFDDRSLESDIFSNLLAYASDICQYNILERIDAFCSL